MPRFAIAPLGLTTEGSTKFKLKGWKCYLKNLQCIIMPASPSCWTSFSTQHDNIPVRDDSRAGTVIICINCFPTWGVRGKGEGRGRGWGAKGRNKLRVVSAEVRAARIRTQRDWSPIPRSFMEKEDILWSAPRVHYNFEAQRIYFGCLHRHLTFHSYCTNRSH